MTNTIPETTRPKTPEYQQLWRKMMTDKKFIKKHTTQIGIQVQKYKARQKIINQQHQTNHQKMVKQIHKIYKKHKGEEK